MKFELEPLHRNTPLEAFIEDMKTVATNLGRKKLTTEEYARHGTYHPATVAHRFGSWNEALKQAGLEISKPHRIPLALLFSNLEQMWRRLGRQPSHTEMCKPPSAVSGRVYERRFGTWRKALEAFVEHINANGTNEAGDPALSPLLFDHKTSRNVPWQLRFKVMQRDNFRCVACGNSPAKDPAVILHVDHIHPWTNGGETELSNLQTLCSVCNIGKSDMTGQM